MDKLLAPRILARTAIRSLSSPLTAARTASPFSRAFSQTSARREDGNDVPPPPANPPPRAPSQPTSAPMPPSDAMGNLIRAAGRPPAAANHVAALFGNVTNRADEFADGLDGGEDADMASLRKGLDDSVIPYHFNVFATKRNTHITVSKPNREVIISMSTGQLGFKKSNRKHYDSAYQLGAYVLDKMNSTGLTNQINKMEVVLNGFGPGREAITKILLGTEGRRIRDKVRRVADSTKLKFGGTRSRKPRRLG